MARRDMTSTELALIKSLGERGEGVTTIARTLNRSNGCISRWLRKLRVGVGDTCRHVELPVLLPRRTHDALERAAARRGVKPEILTAELVAGVLFKGAIDRTLAMPEDVRFRG